MEEPPRQPGLFEVERDPDSDAWRIRVRGSIRDADADGLAELLDEAVAWSSGDVTIQLAPDAELDQAAIDVVIETRRALTGMGRRLLFSREGP